jgi:hypothetical protein
MVVDNKKRDRDLDIAKVKEAFNRDPPPKQFSDAEWNTLMERSTEMYNHLMDALQAISPDHMTPKIIIPTMSSAVYAALVSCTHNLSVNEKKMFVIDFVADIMSHLAKDSGLKDLI